MIATRSAHKSAHLETRRVPLCRNEWLVAWLKGVRRKAQRAGISHNGAIWASMPIAERRYQFRFLNVEPFPLRARYDVSPPPMRRTLIVAERPPCMGDTSLTRQLSEHRKYTLCYDGDGHADSTFTFAPPRRSNRTMRLRTSCAGVPIAHVGRGEQAELCTETVQEAYQKRRWPFSTPAY